MNCRGVETLTALQLSKLRPRQPEKIGDADPALDRRVGDEEIGQVNHGVRRSSGNAVVGAGMFTFVNVANGRSTSITEGRFANSAK